MSDEEEVVSGEEAPAPAAPRRQVEAKPVKTEGLDDESRVLLTDNAKMRAEMAAEIEEMRARSFQRKKEREEEERRLASARSEEERVRKEQEEERRRAKEADDVKRKEERMAKMAEFEKLKNPSTPNFVIKKRDPSAVQEGEDEDEGKESKKSKEQLEAEKQAILAQRIKPLNTEGFDAGKLGEKAKELYKELFKLECDKYDLEKRFKEQQYDMMELAERARSVNKVGKGGLKRVQLGQDDEVDQIQARYSSAPAKIIMYSQFERQKDKRGYRDRKTLFTGPIFGMAADRIRPQRKLIWSQAGLPQYEEEPEGAEEE